MATKTQVKKTSKTAVPDSALTPNRSGVMPYRLKGGKLEVLLITAMSDGRWIVPKGNFEPGMTRAESAVKEGFEEGGVLGHVDEKPLGIYDYTMNKHYIVELYPLEVTKVLKNYPEVDHRERHWFDYQTASKMVREPGLRALILGLAKRVRARAK